MGENEETAALARESRESTRMEAEVGSIRAAVGQLAAAFENMERSTAKEKASVE
jgi:hypothetical protein